MCLWGLLYLLCKSIPAASGVQTFPVHLYSGYTLVFWAQKAYRVDAYTVLFVHADTLHLHYDAGGC